MSESAGPPATRSARARAHALETAGNLFYANGVRAVGMEQIVETSGIAKTTIYRHFPTKDALVHAFLEVEDREFWEQWDAIVDGSADGPAGLAALCGWIGERVLRDGYRGCPQLNVAAEFADTSHPARILARAHKLEMHRRIEKICTGMGLPRPGAVAMQIALLFDGAFMSDGRLNGFDAPALLGEAVERITSRTHARASIDGRSDAGA